MYEYTCGDCGVKGWIPFKVDSSTLFYCETCFPKRRPSMTLPEVREHLKNQFMVRLTKNIALLKQNRLLPAYAMPRDPNVILLMPIQNATKYWPQVSESLYELDPQPSFYIFAENNSTDDTLKLISQFDRPKEILRFWFRDDALDFCETQVDLIGIVRQFLLQRAQKLNPDFAIFLDSDISVSSRNLINRLTMWSDNSIIGGMYQLHHPHPSAVVEPFITEKHVWKRSSYPTSGLKEISGEMSGGCMCLPRKVIQDRRLRFYPVKHDSYKEHETLTVGQEVALGRGGSSKWHVGEDVNYCWRAWFLDYRLFIDYGIFLEHLSCNDNNIDPWRKRDPMRDPLRMEAFRLVSSRFSY
jgi:CxxC-x17-CxxC domain-containing protein